jgi:hypothetical protein
VTTALTPYRSSQRASPDSFAQLLRAEWTKFRTVRGWVIGMILAMLLIVLFELIGHDTCTGPNGSACPAPPVGPGGEAVSDTFYFVYQPLVGNGSITTRVTSLTSTDSGEAAGLQPWSKAGIIVAESTTPGAAYAAMMVTGGHGVRLQYNYTQDTAGLPGAVSAAAPRWLRLTRSGDTLTGYDSADGTHWTKVGSASLTGLPSTVPAGLFVTSPTYQQVSHSLGGGSGVGVPTEASADFDHVALSGGRPGNQWVGDDVGAGRGTGYAALPGDYQHSDGRFTVMGSGDIAPEVPGGNGLAGSIAETLVGTFAGLIVVVVVGTMFITAEYRRGLVRTTLTASPRRGRVLTAKAIVIGVVSFVAGVPAVFVAIWLGERTASQNGVFIDPLSALTEVRVVAGTAALLGIAAMLALAIGATLRRSAAAVATVVVVIVLPYLLSTVPGVLPTSASLWLLRVTPAAGIAIQQAYPRYQQVNAPYATTPGYYPLAPWIGFAVLCGYAALALGLAIFLLRRRDA